MPKPLNSPPKQLGSNVNPADIYGTYSGGRGPGTMGGSAIGGHVGGVDPEPVEKLPDTSVSSVSVERSRYNISSKIDPLPWLTPEYLVQAHMTARRGFLQRAAICWHDMAATDGKLLVLIGKRCASVTRYG